MKSASEAYAEKLLRPEWAIKRLEVFEYANFTCARCGVSGVELHAHHKYYTKGKEPWQYPLSAFECLCARCHFQNHEAEKAAAALRDPRGREKVRKGVRGLVSLLAGQFGIHSARPERPPEFDSGRVWEWTARITDKRVRGALMKFAHWLWNTGTQDMDAIIQIVEDRCIKNPANPYAYYAPGGDARSCKADTVAIDRAESDNNRIKAEEREWLSGK